MKSPIWLSPKLVFSSVALSLMLSGKVEVKAQQQSSGKSTEVSTKSRTLKTGTFKNGLRYYIQHNKSPANRAEIWLAVDAGSIQEDDDQLGFAHLLEHMAFNGTRKLPGNTMLDIIEQSGMSFGADLNAYTSFDETVYQLAVPTDKQSYIDNGLSIVHEWASGGMLIDSMDVVMERGVVLGEWRQRFIDSIPYRQFREGIAREMGGSSKYMDRLPIGSPDLLKNANPSALKRYYTDWYRPDLMAVIVVGDIDTDEIYHLVKEKFENIPAPAARRAFERPGINYDSVARVNVVKDYVNPLIRVSWRIPPASSSREDVIRERALRSLLWDHINTIFSRYSRAERRPFAFAALDRGRPITRAMGKRIELLIAMSPDSVEHALSYALNEIEKVANDGISDADLEKAKEILLRSWRLAADRADAVPSRSLATRYVADFLDEDGPLITSREQLETGERVLKNLTSDDIRQAADFWKDSARRYVTIDIPLFASVRSPTEAEVLEMMTPSSVTQYVTANKVSFPVTTAAATGSSSLVNSAAASPASNGIPSTESPTIISEEDYGVSGVKSWTLSNGARVVYKETNNNPDEVIVHAISPGGFSKLPDSMRMSSGRLIADLMTASGSPGVNDRTQFIENLRRSGLTRFSVTLSGFREEVALAGSARNPEVLFETMHRQFTDPHIDSIAFDEWKRNGARSLTYSQVDRFAYSLTGDKRLAPPSAINVRFMNLDKGMAVYRDRFGDASDFTFYIVGAIPEGQARELATRYIAVLPSTNRQSRESLISTDASGGVQGKITTTEKSPRLQAVQAMANIDFRGYLTAESDQILEEQSRLNTVSWILSRRLRNKLREEMSVTYGASAQAAAVPIPDWYYNLGIQFMTAPEDIRRSVDSVWSVINDLKANGPTPEELEMSSKIQQRRWENAQQNNMWWVSQLHSFEQMGMPFSRLVEPVTTQVDIEEYRELIKKYLPDNQYVQTIMIPTDETLKKARELP